MICYDYGQCGLRRRTLWQCDLLLCQRRNLYAHRFPLSVRIVKLQGVSVRIRVGIGVEYLISTALHMPHANGPVNVAHNMRAHRRRTVRIEHTVNAEVQIMHIFPMIAAIGVAAILMKHRMVTHFPYASAHKVIIGIDLVPIAFDTTGSNTHSVGILTQEIRAVIQLLFLACMGRYFVDLLDRCIHFTANIIGNAGTVDHALVVDRRFGILFKPGIHGIHIFIAASLVAKAPHNDRCVGLVTTIETFCTVQIVCFPRRIMADGIVICDRLHGKRAMGLDIGFVDHINAIFVAKLQQQRIRRIV